MIIIFENITNIYHQKFRLTGSIFVNSFLIFLPRIVSIEMFFLSAFFLSSLLTYILLQRLCLSRAISFSTRNIGAAFVCANELEYPCHILSLNATHRYRVETLSRFWFIHMQMLRQPSDKSQFNILLEMKFFYPRDFIAVRWQCH